MEVKMSLEIFISTDEIKIATKKSFKELKELFKPIIDQRINIVNFTERPNDFNLDFLNWDELKTIYGFTKFQAHIIYNYMMYNKIDILRITK